MKRAIAKSPATIKKASTPTHRFKAYTVSQLLESYRDPRAVLLEIAGTETIALAKQLDCTLIEAMGERRLAAQTVLPYVAQKLPVQVDMRHTRAIHLNIVDATQYTQLQQIAEGAETIEAQLITSAVHESAIEDGDIAPETQPNG